MSEAQRSSFARPREHPVVRESDQVSHRVTWSADLDVGRGSLAPRAEDPATGIEYADFPRRAIAFVLDFVMVQTTATVVLQMTGFIAGITLLSQNGVTDNALSAWAGFFIPTVTVGLLQAFVYVFFLRGYRATPGQVILGINTVRGRDGDVLGRGKGFLRWLVTLAPAWAIAGSSNLGVWWSAGIQHSQSISADAVNPSGLAITLPIIWFAVLFVSSLVDSRGRGLHDRLAGSVVVREG